MSTTPLPPLILSDAKYSALESVEFVGCIILRDNGTLSLGDDSNETKITTSKIIIPMLSNEALGANLVLKIVESVGGEARVTVVSSSDDSDTPMIGTSINSTTAAEEIVHVCVGGVFTAVVENGETINIGGAVHYSSSDDGRVVQVTGDGTIGVALTSGTGDAAGTVTIRGLFTKNEIF